jgi:hypothetical protein
MKVKVKKYQFGNYREIELHGTIDELRALLKSVEYRTPVLGTQGGNITIFHFFVGKHEYNYFIHGH